MRIKFLLKGSQGFFLHYPKEKPIKSNGDSAAKSSCHTQHATVMKLKVEDYEVSCVYLSWTSEQTCYPVVVISIVAAT